MDRAEVRDYYKEVREFAEKTGQLKQFDEQISFLDTYAEGDDRGRTRCVLGKDCAPRSFSFMMQRRSEKGEYANWFNGGLIYHGTHDGGGDGGAPTFSVNITPMDGWQVHT